MRSLKFIYVVLVLIFSGLSYSDNNSINGTCPGEIIEEIDGATTNATHTENGNIGGGGNDRYRMTFPVSGTLDISSANTNPARNANYRFYISRNSCGNNDSDWNIENSYTGTSPSFSVPVNAGDTIYIRFKTISGQANNNRHAYALSLNFTANTDTITSFTAPSQVTIGETITVTVDYEVSEDREIVTGFQQNHAPWDGWDWTSVIVSTGTGTVNLTFTVPNSIPLGNAYQIPIVLQPVGGGWLTRLDDKVENPVNVVASVPPNTCNASHGLIGNYYNNNSYTAPIALSRVDSNIDFAWGGGSPDGSINSDNFSVEWTGTIYIPEDADYTFSLAHDDVFELIIDGNTIYNNGTWTGGSSTFIDATPVHLTPGIHPIAVRLIEQSGGAYARLAWRNNAGINSQTIVPNINFCTTGMPLVATDDQYNTSSGLTLTGNFMTDDTGNGVDSGLNIQASTSPSTAPTKGTLTINTNGSFTYVPELNATGSDFFDYTITDIQGNSTTATVVINLPIASPSTMGAFQQRYINNLKGNIRIIGNTVLQSPTPTSTLANHRQNLFYVDIDGDGSTFNSSSADINATESGVDVTGARIVWAALYWQGYLHNDDLDTGADTQFNTFNTNSPNINISETRILNSIQNQSILFKVGNGSYTAISPHALGIDRQYFGTNTDPNYVSYKYGAFAEVTSLLQNSPPNATYTVANIPTRSGQASSSTYDSLGNYGAWALVVVYDNTQNADEKTRNVSIYDGYVVLSAANNPNQTISVSGFKTPKIAPNGVDSTLSIFAAEGDRYILGDFAQITNQDGTTFNLPDTSGAGSYFASIIEGVPDRNPVILNNNGIDIHTTQVGTVPGGVGAIQTNHISASITLGTTQDTFMPSLISFATELYVPEICYDYTIQQDGFDITDSGDNAREFSTTGAGEVSISIAIKSKEGDFDFENSKLNFELLPTIHTTFIDALYSPNNVNTYIPAIYSTGHTSLKPSIAIGELPSVSGGTIKALQKYYSKFNYKPDTSHYSGKFEFDLNTTLDFGSGPVPILLSSTSGTIDRCTQSNRYDPTYASFNVERKGSNGTPEQKYPLYTQIVGKDFDFEVVAYKKDPMPAYSSELPLSGYTVDVELINVRTFNDQNETFACNNPDSYIIQTLTAAGDKQVFASFSGNSRVDMSSVNIQTDTALRNAAFRVWYMVDENNTIIPHNCSDPSSNSCFQNIYDTHLMSSDITLQASGTLGFCSVSTLGAGGCSSYSNPELGTSGCYACLRDFFSKAVCSRDNFSIRPAAYRIAVVDNNESNNSNDPSLLIALNDRSSDQVAADIVAGYRYRMDINATSYASTGPDDIKLSKGYTRVFDNGQSAQVNPDLASVLHFDDTAACYDHNDTLWNIGFIDGQVRSISLDSIGRLLSHNQVGKYYHNIHDSNWTIVDQARYPYKTFANIDDCILNDNSIPNDSISKSGCDIDSKHTANTNINNNIIYNNLYLQYHPDRFGLLDIILSTVPTSENRLFMSDFNNSHYDDPVVNPIDMGSLLDGSISALSKTGTVLTNYTDQCVANDVNLTLSVSSSSSYIDLSTSFQQYLQYGSAPADYKQKELGLPKTLTVKKEAFENNVSVQSLGTASIKIYTTYQKPTKNTLENIGREGLNPTIITYNALNATDTNDSSSAYMALHRPKGLKSYDQNQTFLYGRVVADEMVYMTTADKINATLSVVAYCDLPGSQCQDVYSLGSGVVAENISTSWKTMRFVNPGNSDNTFVNLPQLTYGRVDMNNHNYDGVYTSIALTTDQEIVAPYEIKNDKGNVLQNLVFNNAGIMQNISVSMDNPAPNNRPTTVTIGYYPASYLKYYRGDLSVGTPNLQDNIPNKTLNDGFAHKNFSRFTFLPTESIWTGKGKTGHTVDDDIKQKRQKRIEW